MKEKELKEQLGRFMDGATTLDEERRLAAYFRTCKAGGEFEPYRQMFALWDDGRVWVEPSAPRRSRRPWLRRVAAVACGAAAVAVLTVSFGPEVWKNLSSEATETGIAWEASQSVAAAAETVPAAEPAVPAQCESRVPRRLQSQTLAAGRLSAAPDCGVKFIPYVEPSAAEMPDLSVDVTQLCVNVTMADIRILSPSRQRALRDIARVYAENTYVSTSIEDVSLHATLASFTH